MAKGISFQTIAQQIGKSIPKINPAQIIASTGISVAKKQSMELFGYDFTGLVMKLFLYFTFAFLFSKFMEGVILVRGFWVTMANFFGFQIPQKDQVPKVLQDLFNGGYAGFKFWDIIKIVAILLVLSEYFVYWEQNKKTGGTVSPMTTGVFILLIVILGVTTIPELMSKLKKTSFSLEQFR